MLIAGFGTLGACVSEEADSGLEVAPESELEGEISGESELAPVVTSVRGDIGPQPPERFNPLTRCLGQPTVTSAAGVVHAQFSRRAPAEGTTFDLRSSTFLANEDDALYPDNRALASPLPGRQCMPKYPDGSAIEARPTEKYPVAIGGALPLASNLCVLGGVVVGKQHRDVPWRVMKQVYDGDGIRVEAAGLMTVIGSWFDNIEDAVSPRGTGTFLVSHVYARNVRDDFVENDGMLSGEIDDVLVDGTFIFLSQRPGSGGLDPAPATSTVKVRNALVHLTAQRWDTDIGGAQGFGAVCDGTLTSWCEGDAEPRCVGVAPGMPFKWSMYGGRLEVRDSTFLIDAVSVNGINSMLLPSDAYYQNVTIVWRGTGVFPVTVPPGVTVVTDVGIWNSRRAAWLARHGCDAAGDVCTNLVQ